MRLADTILFFAVLSSGAVAVGQALPAEIDSSATSPQVSAAVDGSAPISAVSADELTNVRSTLDQQSVKTSKNLRGQSAHPNLQGLDASRIAASTAGMSRAQKDALAAAATKYGYSSGSAAAKSVNKGHLETGGKGPSSLHSAALHPSTKVEVAKTGVSPVGTAPTPELQTPSASSLGSALGDGIHPQLGDGIKPKLGSGALDPYRATSTASKVRAKNDLSAGTSYGERYRASAAEPSNKAAAGAASSVHKSLHESMQSSRPKSLKQRRAEERQAACHTCRN